MPFIITSHADAAPYRSRRAVATLEEAWLAVESIERDADGTAYFYRRARLSLGTLVLSADDPGRRGVIVKRGGQQWTTRDRAPYVRWDRRIPSDQVPWERLLLMDTTLRISALGGTITLQDGIVIEVESTTYERLGELANDGADEHQVDWSEGLYLGGNRCYGPILGAVNDRWATS